MQNDTIPHRGLTVLIVDDSAMMRLMIRRAVSLSGAPIAALHEACDGRSALDLLERQQIDVVFTDLNMPVMSGTELLRAIAARSLRCPLRIVVSTDASGARRRELQELGVRQYVEKPFSPEVIRDVLVDVCAGA